MASPSVGSATNSSTAASALTDTERAVLGDLSVAEVQTFFSAYVEGRLGHPIAEVLFRAGRIDVVWGVALADGREVVVKSHRRPVDLEALAAARDAKRTLRAADFPCPDPLAGPEEVHGQILSLETRLGEGSVPDGHVPAHRRLLAWGLARHIEVLRGEPGLRDRAGTGPSWCRYQAGPWPVPHDPIVDFRTTPPGYEWLDDYARQAADQILTHRASAEVVLGHADWYAGNTSVADGAVVGTFDWELVADTEAVIAGFTAACYAASSTSGAGLSTPEEVAVFLQDYEAVRGVLFTDDEQRAAAGAAGWILGFNARWELGMKEPGADEGNTLTLVRARQQDYLSLAW